MVRGSRRRQTWVSLVCLLLATYFGYHAIKGKHGLEAQAALSRRAERLKVELAGLETMRSDLERDIALLGDKTVDPDYLDELARSVAGFARPGDVLIIDPR
jgi:cell division protein FtsB